MDLGSCSEQMRGSLHELGRFDDKDREHQELEDGR